VEETEVPGENHRPVASQWQTSLHNIISGTPRHERDSSSQHLVAIDTDCIGCCKSNYHTITTTASPFNKWRISFIFSLVSIQQFFFLRFIITLAKAVIKGKSQIYLKWVKNIKKQQHIVKIYYMGIICITLKEKKYKTFFLFVAELPFVNVPFDR